MCDFPENKWHTGDHADTETQVYLGQKQQNILQVLCSSPSELFPFPALPKCDLGLLFCFEIFTRKI